MGSGRWGPECGGIIRLGAVVVTVTVVVMAAPLGVTEPGDAVHVDNVSPAGSTQVTATAELNPPMGVTVTVMVAGEPAFTVGGTGAEAAIEKSTALVPFPVNGAVWGLPPASSVIVSVPGRVPNAVGVNVTLIMQFAPAAKLAPQGLLEMAKSPEIVIELIVRTALPVLVSVTVFAALRVFSTWLPKSRLVGASPTPGAAAAPVPVRLTSNA